jgi:hypothetical protein
MLLFEILFNPGGYHKLLKLQCRLTRTVPTHPRRKNVIMFEASNYLLYSTSLASDTQENRVDSGAHNLTPTAAAAEIYWFPFLNIEII